jgi:biopolymer transport protein ExbD
MFSLFRKPQREDNAGMYDINMTPLIDVSLVLVVILLLATPLAFESAIALQRAAASGKTAPDPTKQDRVEIEILSSDLVRVNRTEIELSGLAATLRPLLAKSSTQHVIVDCDGDVPHGTFVEVLDQAKLCGASMIAFQGG